MAIIESTKNEMQTHMNRTLYQVKEVYEDGMVYYGYYVENFSDTQKRGQAYRFKTVIGNEVNIEDENAFEKAQNTLKNGFSF